MASVVVVAVVVLYVKISASHRLAPPFEDDATIVWAEVDLQLPRDRAWLLDRVVIGSQQRSERSGEAIAEVTALRTDPESGAPVVTFRLRAVRNASGTLFYGNDRLIPGRSLEIALPEALVEGVVYKVAQAGG